MYRVGIVAMEAIDTSGGAFTFQHEVVRTLFQQPPSPGVEWVVITPPDGIVTQLHLNSNSIESVEMTLSARDHKIGLALHLIKSHAKSIVSGDRFKGETQRRSEYFEGKLQHLNLDMVWYLGPYPATQEIPYVLTVWDIQHRLQPWFPEVSSNGIWTQRELVAAPHVQRSTLIMVGNDVGARQLASTYSIPPDRIKINPLPVPTDAIEFHANPAPRPSIESFCGEIGEFILYPAQFWAHKNHKVLLDALALLKAANSNVPKLVLTGSDKGNLVYVNSLISELKISEHVINLGFVNRVDLLYLYSKAIALVFPSMFGPDNIPPLEAMALNCPVLVTDDSGMREQLGSAAIYLQPTDALAWAKAIEALMTDPSSRETLVSKGRDRIRNCTTDKYVQTTQSHILEFKKIRETWPT